MRDTYHNTFTFLPIKDLITCSQVSKSFNSIYKDEFLWTKLLKRDYNKPIATHNNFNTYKFYYDLSYLKKISNSAYSIDEILNVELNVNYIR